MPFIPQNKCSIFNYYELNTLIFTLILHDTRTVDMTFDWLKNFAMVNIIIC